MVRVVVLKDKSYVMKCETIGVVHSCFSEKFGIPRQARLAPSAGATIELVAPYNREEMVRGLDSYSHIWIQFLFHRAISEGWKTTVRPPRLGGKERVGIFATRSPHRPNHIGISAVKLEAIKSDNGLVMVDVSGVDLLDGTPVIDLKPYIPYSDSVDGAEMGLALEKMVEIEVIFLAEAEMFCRDYESKTGRNLGRLIREILQEDPRPASQRKTKSEFGMYLWDVNVRWSLESGVCTVVSCGIGKKE